MSKKRISKKRISKNRINKNRLSKKNKIVLFTVITFFLVALFCFSFWVLGRIKTNKENRINANRYIQLEADSENVFRVANGLYDSDSIREGKVDGVILNTYSDVIEKHKKSSWGERAFFSFSINHFTGDNLLVLEFSAQSDKSTPTLVDISCGKYSTSVEVDNSKHMYYVPLVGDLYGEITFGFNLNDDSSPIYFGNICVAEYSEGCNISQVKSGQYLAEEFAVWEIKPEDEAIRSVYAEGNGKYIYSVYNGELTVYDTKAGDTPTPVGFLDGLGYTGCVFLEEEKNLLFVTSNGSGLYLVDVSDPAAPFLVSFYDTLEICDKPVVSGDYAFLCEESLGIEVVNISDPGNPQYVTHIQEPSYGTYKECKIKNGYLYAICYNTRKTDVYDIQNLAHVQPVSSIFLDAAGMSLDIQGDYLYVATAASSSAMNSKEAGADKTKRLSTGSGNGFEVYDISNPLEPALVSKKRIDGRLTDFNQNSFEVQVRGDNAYFNFGKAGIYLYDVHDPCFPKRIENIFCRNGNGEDKLVPGEDYMPYPFDKESRRNMIHMVLCEGSAFCLSSDSELLSVDVEYTETEDENEKSVITGIPSIPEPLQPENYVCRKTALSGDIYALAELEDGDIALACGMEGIKICNRNLEEITSVASGYPVKDIRVNGGLIYSAEGIGGFAIYRYSNGMLEMIGRKAEKKYTAYYDSLEITEDGKLALVQAGYSRYKYVDCTNPEKPVIIATESEKTIRRMKHRSVCVGVVNHNYLGLAGPQAMNWFSEKGNGDGFQMSETGVEYQHKLGDYNGFASFGEDCILITNRGYQLINPETDEEILHVDMEDWDGGKCVAYGNTLVISNAVNGKITILDLTNPENPGCLLKLDTDYVTDVPSVIGGDIYVPLRHDGVLKITKK